MRILVGIIRIAGFRGIKSIEVSLPRVAVLIGTNNAGKTSFLKALHLALGDYSRHLSEEDFHIDADDTRVQEILVDIRIVPVDDNGNPTQSFNEQWATEFGDKIKAEADGSQYVAIRTRSKANPIKGGFDTVRFSLERWPSVSTWCTEKVKETKTNFRLTSMPFYYIEAQRDIHQEFKEKSSFVGKVLSGVEYDEDIVAALELQIKAVNDEAVSKSSDLKSLKEHLEKLNHSFHGSGSAEITPFPKRIRDLSKHFSVHFGESVGGTFSMEYHGMGTRSWASMLTVKAFTELMVAKHKKELEPFFPVLAAEEPEAHLHPNAQKTLYRQLAESKGQVVVSTHSPYLAAMAHQFELIHLIKSGGNIKAYKLSLERGTEEYRRVQREVLHSRGEILFSKALVLCEGETEEQALPILFSKFFGKESFELGVNIIGVGGSGKKYLPFLTFARDFAIPVFIFSDGEEKTTRDLKKHYEAVFGETDIFNSPKITILESTNFEGYLINSGFITTIETVIAELDGDEAIEEWIKKRHGTFVGREKTKSPQCPQCSQSIFADIYRDFKTGDGYKSCLIDKLCSDKTRFAPAVAVKLSGLEPNLFPSKLIEFFTKLKDGVAI